MEAGPPWEVHAEVAVRCDGRIDCGSHQVEEVAARRFDSPRDAAWALLDAATWLRERGVAEPLESWRPRDIRSGHS